MSPRPGTTMSYGSPTRMNADSFVNGRWGNCGVLGPAFLTEWCYLCDHAHGLSGRQIGRRLSISTRTVEGHLSTMRRRIGARSEAELTAYGVAAGLLSLGPALGGRNGASGRDGPYPRPGPGAGKRPFAGTSGQELNPQDSSAGNTRRKSTPENLPAGSFRHMLFG